MIESEEARLDLIQHNRNRQHMIGIQNNTSLVMHDRTMQRSYIFSHRRTCKTVGDISIPCEQSLYKVVRYQYVCNLADA